jgi:hypothetical protein
VHQLGYAWLDGRFTSRARCALWCLGGLAALALLTHLGPWPRSLVGIPGVAPSNTTPPHIPLLALAAFQLGGLLLAQRGLAALLENVTLWAVTVLVNGMIMTLFLWHSTVMVLLFGAAVYLDGFGLSAQPGSVEWWILRIPWMGVFAVALLPTVAVFQRFEAGGAHAIHSPPVWRSVAGAALIVAGLAQLALGGMGGDGILGLNVLPLLLVALGGLLAGLGPRASAAAPFRAR